jgi:hypothetical protein
MTHIAESAVDRRDIAVIHVRFAGRSFDLRLGRLELTNGASDGQVKRAVAGHLEVPAAKLDDYVVDRHVNGNLTLRPQAVFG